MMREERSKSSTWMRRILAISLALLLVSSALVLVNQLLWFQVTSTTGTEPMENETLPDLSVTTSDVYLSDPVLFEGDVVSIYADVHNIGGLPADNVTVEFWDDVCEGCDGMYLVGSDVLDMVPPYGKATASASWDTTGQPGLNMITVIVDPEDLIEESSELNNQAWDGFPVIPSEEEFPTVQVVTPNGGNAWEGWGDVWTGGTVHSVVWTMADDNDSALFVRIHYSEFGGLGPWILITEGTYPVGSNSHPWLVPEIYTEFAFVRVCAWDDGNQTGCDTNDEPFQIDSWSPLLLLAEPGEAQTTDVPLNTPFQAVFDERMDATSVEASFQVDPEVGGIEFHWDYFGSLLTITHDPFEPQTAYTWGLDCQALDFSDPGNALDMCPWTFQFETGDDLLPNLTLTMGDLWWEPMAPKYGDSVTIYAEVHNTEPVDAINVSVAFWDNGICLLPVQYLIGYDYLPVVPGNGSAVASVTWDTTESADGSDNITVMADADQTIPETNEWDNWADAFIYVSDTPCEGNATCPDLTVSPADIHFSDDTPDEGEDVVITAIIRNVGLEDAFNVTVEFQDCLDPQPCTTIGYVYIPLIPMGNVGVANITWTATPAGLHTIVVTADPFDTILELDETNNEASRTILVGTSPSQIFVQATTFDNDNDGRFDDVVILVFDAQGRAVEGASVYIDGTFYGLTSDTGLLLAYNFEAGTHAVQAVFESHISSTAFVSEG